MSHPSDHSLVPPTPGSQEVLATASVAGGFAAARSLKRELLEEQRQSWEEGNPIQPEHLLPRWPTTPEADPDVASLLFEDYLQRQRSNPDASIADYEPRLPQHRDSLVDLVRQHAVLRSLGGSGGPVTRLALPSEGDEVFGFRIRQELGRGAFARVFLAEQAHLAGRPVVLKISGMDGDEPQTLASLQHTHIVPIYSVHEEARAGLRVVCMPYFGGASLSSALQACWIETGTPTRGEHLIQALQVVQGPPASQDTKVTRWQGDKVKAPDPGTSSEDVVVGSPCHPSKLTGLTYVQAAARVVALLAEALQHAHDRGVLHRDIKPSNVLLTADGEPMLLDFNLAQNRRADEYQESGGRPHATLGGTVAYMAPEHLRALAGRNPALVRRVDERADLYSLGMVLYEMLTNRTPFDQSGSYTLLPAQIEALAVERARTIPSLRRHRGDVPWSLESIARKCLMPDAEKRYQRADHLAADLHAFLHDLPLRHAPELSWAERARKWARRHPRLMPAGSVAGVAALLLLTVGTALVGVRGSLAGAREQLGTAWSRERKLAHEAGTLRALCLVNTTLSNSQASISPASISSGSISSGSISPVQNTGSGQNTGVGNHLREGKAACEEALALYGVLDQEDWQEASAWQRLAPAEREEVAEDTRELLLLLAWARTRTAPGDRAVLRQALALLDKADAIHGLGPSRALWEDRAHYLDQLGEGARANDARDRARQTLPTGARDHYLLASAYVRQAAPGQLPRAYALAVAELDCALRLNPRHYWSWVQRGICRQELGEYTLAAGDFGVCIGLWPEFAWGYFNRGCVLGKSGKKMEAVADYSAALKRDPGFALAYLNRGLIRLELKQYRPALDDFREAGARGHDEAFLHAGRGVALEGVGLHEQADDAFRMAFLRTQRSRAAEIARLRWVYGFAVARRLPNKASRAFEEVLERDPNHPQALYGRGMLLVGREGRLDEAIDLFTRALRSSPDFVEARCFRAVLQARRGRFEEAARDINWCLRKQPREGATLYAAACVAARGAEKIPDPPAARRAGDQSIALLRLAFEHGYGKDRAAADPDLAALHRRPDFHQLLRAGGSGLPDS